MSESCSTRRTRAVVLSLLMVLSTTLLPLAGAEPSEQEDASPSSEAPSDELPESWLNVASLDDFTGDLARPYLLIEESTPVVSATPYLRQQWVEAGRPGIVESTASTSGRACNQHVVGDQLTVPSSGGSISVTVAKTTASVAFLVQTGRTLSSTVLQNLASTWDPGSTRKNTSVTYGIRLLLQWYSCPSCLSGSSPH